jgi:hypothetical protein
MKFVVLIVCTVLACPYFVTHANAARTTKAENESIDSKIDFTMSVSGLFSSPKKLFSDNYESSAGFLFGAGVIFTDESDSIPGETTFLLAYSRDYFDISGHTRTTYAIGTDADATLSALQTRMYRHTTTASFKGVGIHPVFGVGIGGAKFSLKDENFNKMGGTTLTELKHENDKTQLSEYSELGIMLDGMGPISLHYSYQLVEIQRAWKFAHWFINSSIEGFTVFGIPQRFSQSVGEDLRESNTFRLATVLYQVGMTVLWYQISYDYNNWPFDDESPLHYHRQLLTLTFTF